MIISLKIIYTDEFSKLSESADCNRGNLKSCTFIYYDNYTCIFSKPHAFGYLE